MMIGLSHVAKQTMLNSMRVSVAPAIFIHSSAVAKCQNYSNVGHKPIPKIPTTFLIKHKSGGKFIHPNSDHRNPSNDTKLVLQHDIHNMMHYQFDVREGHWGYIKHVSSGKIFHPKGGNLFPGNDKDLILHSDRHDGALFALDSVNDIIIHKGGRFVHPYGGSPNPGNDTEVVLHEERHAAMKFQFVSPDDHNKEVMVYGKPTVFGYWRIINSIIDPKADHIRTRSYKVGMSKTNSKSSTFKFKWEMSDEFSASKIFDSMSASMTTSTEYMIQRASSSTWSEEKCVTDTIQVVPGKSVVTWQYVFEASQCDHRAVFYTDILADTSCVSNQPDDLADVAYDH